MQWHNTIGLTIMGYLMSYFEGHWGAISLNTYFLMPICIYIYSSWKKIGNYLIKAASTYYVTCYWKKKRSGLWPHKIDQATAEHTYTHCSGTVCIYLGLVRPMSYLGLYSVKQGSYQYSVSIRSLTCVYLLFGPMYICILLPCAT